MHPCPHSSTHSRTATECPHYYISFFQSSLITNYRNQDRPAVLAGEPWEGCCWKNTNWWVVKGASSEMMVAGFSGHLWEPRQLSHSWPCEAIDCYEDTCPPDSCSLVPSRSRAQLGSSVWLVCTCLLPQQMCKSRKKPLAFNEVV